MKLDQVKAIKWMIGTLLAIVIGSAQAAWWAANNLALKKDLMRVAAEASVGVERELKIYMSELTLLESKPNKTPYDLARIKYLQKEIEHLLKLKRS